MKDNNNPGAGAMPAQGDTPAIGASVTSDGTSGETHTTTPTTIEDALKELEAARAALKRANGEAATHRHKAKELDDLKAKLEQDKLTETEKLQKQLAELQKQHE